MIRVLFVCHGNICRSPMAEFICKKKIKERGLEKLVYAESAATSYEEIGNPLYPPAKRKLTEKGITDFMHKRARHMEKTDYAGFDYLIGMDRMNIRNMLRILGDDPQKKVHMMMEYAQMPVKKNDEENPWWLIGGSGWKFGGENGSSYDDIVSRGAEEVDDPWYTGDFDGVYNQLDIAIDGLLDEISESFGREKI